MCYSPLLNSTLLSSTSSLLYSTLLYSTLLFSTLLYCTYRHLAGEARLLVCVDVLVQVGLVDEALVTVRAGLQLRRMVLRERRSRRRVKPGSHRLRIEQNGPTKVNNKVRNSGRNGRIFAVCTRQKVQATPGIRPFRPEFRTLLTFVGPSYPV